ncbi:hypothetical protein ACTFIV_003965 [Dictyostelium citrinum]
MYSNFTGKGNNDSPFSKPKMPTPGSSIKQPPFNHGPSSLNNPMNGNPSLKSPYRTSLIQKPPIVNRYNLKDAKSFDIHSPPPQPLISNSTIPQTSSQSIQNYMNTPLPHKRSGFTHPTSFPQSSSSLPSTSPYSFSPPPTTTTRTTATINTNKTTTTISTTTSPPLPSNINKTTTTTTSPTLPSNINKTTTTTTSPTLPSNINKTTTILTTTSPTFSNPNKLLQVSRGLDASQPTLRNTLNIFTSKPTTTTTTTTTTTSTTNTNCFNYNENSNNIYNSNTQSNNNSNNYNKSKLFEKEQEFITPSQIFLPDENDPSYALILQMMQEDILENDDREMAKRLGGELDGDGGFSYDRQSRTTNSFYNEYETEEEDYSGGNDYDYSGVHNVNDIDLSYENLVQLEPVVVGATKKQIESVEETLYLDPVGRNKQKNYKNTQGHDTRCAICLCDFESNDLIKILPKCKHLYHSECIDPWFKASKFCPQCKVEL